MRATALVLKYNKWNKYSFAVLVGALELDERVTQTPIISDAEGTLTLLSNLSTRFDHIIVGYSLMSPRFTAVTTEIKKIKTRFHRHN